MGVGAWMNRVKRRLSRRKLYVFHSADYRLPLSSIESMAGLEPRRADYALWYLLDQRAIRPEYVSTPTPVRFSALERAHSRAYLESLDRPEVLGRILGVDPSDVPVAEVQRTMRLATEGTCEAARRTLATGQPSLNLLGGFHHAEPARGGGLCAINDIAVALAGLRENGFGGTVGILDLDAHPSDGLSAFFAEDGRVWMGSISGSDWGPLPGVDETFIPGADDATYLRALDGLLERMPARDLMFVIAGGDVIASDRLGKLALTLEGARQRDLHVATRLGKTPSVWLPGGGYNAESWKVLAGTGMVLALRDLRPIPRNYEPLRAQYSRIRASLDPTDLEGPLLTEEDLFGVLGGTSSKLGRFIGFYTAEGLEYGLYQYGVLDHLRRLGYGRFRVELRRGDPGERVLLFGWAAGEEHLLVELVLERIVIEDQKMLFIHWLTLRNPAARFSSDRPQLPGQETPGLGIAREMVELIRSMARRLGMAGLAYRPAWFHTAYAARYHLRFVDAARQGRFQALIRDLSHLPLLEATVAVAEGHVRLNGEVYTWEPDLMAHWFGVMPEDDGEVVAAMEGARFEVVG